MTKIYTTDSPIETLNLDRFNRGAFAERVGKVIVNRSDSSSLTISICGVWGEGKTTVLNFIENSFVEVENITCINFNPWRFLSEDYILRAFFDHVARGLYSVTNDNDVKSMIEKYFSALSHKPKLANNGDSEASVLLDDLKGLKNRIDEKLKEHKKRLVVLIDDIDRLDKNEIQAIFRLVRLTADFSYITYILAFDDEVVAGAISERYGNGSIKDGKKFLEKIIQVPLYLPKVGSFALQSFVFQCLSEALEDSQVLLNDTEKETIESIFFLGLEPFITTPRLIKRYGQILAFSLSVMKGEVNVVDLVLLEAIKIFYPNLYEVIKKHPEYFSYQLKTQITLLKDTKKKNFQRVRRDYIRSFLKKLDYAKQEASKKLIEFLFPGFDSIFQENREDSTKEEKWDEEQRLISGQYFDRYFSYTITENDISDKQIASFLSEVSSKSVDTIVYEIKQIVTSKNIDLFINKLKLKEKKITKTVAEKLALAIAELGELLPAYRPLFSAVTQASFLISQLISKLSEAEQFEVTKQVIQKANLLSFSLECFFSITERGNTKELFSLHEKEELAKYIVDKIREVAAESIIYIKYREQASILLHLWASHNPDETKEYIAKTFKNDSNNVFSFIEVFCHIDYDFGKILNAHEAYNLLANLVGIDPILEALHSNSNMALDEFSPNNSKNMRTRSIFLQMILDSPSCNGS